MTKTTKTVYALVNTNLFGKVIEIKGTYTNAGHAIADISDPKDRVWEMCSYQGTLIFPTHFKSAVEKIKNNLDQAKQPYIVRDTKFGRWITPELGVTK